MGNANLFKAVGPASIGGEYPECLGTVISVDRASALCTFLSPDFAEDAATDGLAHNLVCVDGDCLMRGDQFVKLDGDACPGASGCRGHLDDVTQNPTSFLYSHAWGQGNILHNPARDHLARSAFPGRKG